jgi:CBS domain-containing protein
MRAADIMTTKVFTIDSIATVADAIAFLNAQYAMGTVEIKVIQSKSKSDI